jgi:bifunctional UDP-N-acetylglucosamine pyrophosphorylase / glucosamine-1-phosphate N-acetyltransferase
VVDSPFGYGRIVRTGQQIARIVEEKDASAAEREIREINSGIYAFELADLFGAVKGIAAENVQKEYYLPDLIQLYRERGLGVETVTVADAAEIQGINSRIELAAVSRIVRDTKNAAVMAAGVTLADPATTYIDRDVVIGADTIIHPGVSLEGKTVVGSGCEIHSGVRVIDSTLGDNVVVLNHCVITGCAIADAASVGPFAHLRRDVSVGEGAKVGNFVEMKNTALGARSKASHLSYLGDAVIGRNVNIGAGTITCNYDGQAKHQTVIGKESFIGTHATLVAPVTVGDGAYVAAHSVITEDVPADSLAIARSRQTVKEGWAHRRREKK